MTPSSRAPELELLRDLAAERATGDAAAREAARAALLTRAAASSREAGAAPARPRLWGGGGASGRGRRFSVRPRQLILVGGLGVALAVVGFGGGGGPAAPGQVHTAAPFVVSLAAPPTAAAAQALGRVAESAAEQPPLAFGPGTRWVTRSSELEFIVDPEGFASGQPKLVTLSTSFSGRVQMRTEATGPPQFTTDASRRAWERAGSPQTSLGKGYEGPLLFGSGAEDAEPTGVFQFGRELLTYDELLALPTQTAALAARVQRATGQRSAPTDPARGWFELGTVTDLMARAPLPPALRAAFWRVAATLPGVQVLGAVKDPVGRPGLGIAVAGGGQRQRIVVDRRTGMLLSDWIYQDSPITTCDRDLAPCDESKTPTDPQGRPWTVLAAPGSVVYGKTFLTAKVVRAD